MYIIRMLAKACRTYKSMPIARASLVLQLELPVQRAAERNIHLLGN